MVREERKMEIKKVIIVLMGSMFLLTSFIPLVVQADANTEFGVYPGATDHYTIGDIFEIVVYLNPGGETVTTWVLEQFLFNTSVVNATLVTIEGFWDTASHHTGTIDNDTGKITDPQSFCYRHNSDGVSIGYRISLIYEKGGLMKNGRKLDIYNGVVDRRDMYHRHGMPLRCSIDHEPE
jgi:hypothetical protein